MSGRCLTRIGLHLLWLSSMNKWETSEMFWCESITKASPVTEFELVLDMLVAALRTIWGRCPHLDQGPSAFPLTRLRQELSLRGESKPLSARACRPQPRSHAPNARPPPPPA